jgi:hypothetical protein
MSSPVNMASLAPATITVVNDPSAQVLLRSGLTDYRAAMNLIRSINLTVPPYTPLASAVANDLMFIQRGSGNFSIMFNQVGFLKGTKMWFYGTAPAGWEIIMGTGNAVCACADGTTPGQYSGINPGFQGGTWTQSNATLTIDQIPAHSHAVTIYPTLSTVSDLKLGSGKNTSIGTSQTSTVGGGQPHNHGSSWRPFANVGSICIKQG